LKLLLLWSFYPEYLTNFYATNVGAAELPYAEQMRLLLDDNFGWPPAVARRIAELGDEVFIVVSNAKPLQQAWARENGVEFSMSNWQTELPLKQAALFRPDVVWLGAHSRYFGAFMEKLRLSCKRVVAWSAAPLNPTSNLRGIDLILTSHDNFVQMYRSAGHAVEKVLPCFEPRIIELAGRQKRDVSISFVGSLSGAHRQRIAILNDVLDRLNVELWCSLPQLSLKNSVRPSFWLAFAATRRIARRSRGDTYGINMYRTLMRSVMTLNVHIGAAGGLAGNMRMFEATGCGALLFTEEMPNVSEMFEPDSEVVTYRDSRDLVDKLIYYSENPDEAAKIAEAGKNRTLTEHTTAARARQIRGIFETVLQTRS
jgi:spore maturation protein CgeB